METRPAFVVRAPIAGGRPPPPPPRGPPRPRSAGAPRASGLALPGRRADDDLFEVRRTDGSRLRATGRRIDLAQLGGDKLVRRIGLRHRLTVAAVAQRQIGQDDDTGTAG